MEGLPKKIGKYDIIDQLGKGSMGVVYKGHDAYVDRPVAIKLATNAADDTDGTAKRMFVNEARSAGRLDHPNILKVYEAGETDGQPYMVMEYVAGGDTLRSHCREETLLPIHDVVRLIRQAADALNYAHTQGVLHRDIKPANIMLTEEGNAKLGDFGIARRMGMDQTQLMGWFGSPLYMSPEQARDADITPQSDLFSLGSLIYEMLAGHPPFAAKGLAGLIQKVCNEEPKSLIEIRPQIPESLWLVVKRMLAKELDARYKTGADIVADLDVVLDLLRHSPVEMTDDQKLERMIDLAFFESFSKPELKEVAKVAVWRRYAAGETIFSQGDQDGAFFVITEGAVEVTINGTRIGNIERGECFGEMEYLARTGRTATVAGNREITVIRIEKDFKEWASLPCQLRLTKVFQKILIARLQETSKALARALN